MLEFVEVTVPARAPDPDLRTFNATTVSEPVDGAPTFRILWLAESEM